MQVTNKRIHAEYHNEKNTNAFIYLLISLLICLSTYFLIAHFTSAHAQQGFSLSIDPPLTTITVIPPVSFSSPITLTNHSTNEVALDVVVKPFAPETTNDGQVHLLDTNSFSGQDPFIREKIQLFENNQVATHITLAPAEKKTLSLHVDLPKDEPPSDYYLSILFITKNASQNQVDGPGILGGIGTNVLLSIGPKASPQGFLKVFFTPFFIQQGPVAFQVLLQNTSNFFINPKAAITVKNMFGQIVGSIPLLPVSILANSSRYLPDKISGSQTMAIWPETILFGIYSATVRVALSPDGPLFTKTIYFIALPYWFVLTLIFCGILISIVAVKIKYTLKEKKSNPVKIT